MEVSRIRALRGPNLWSKNTAIEAIVSCADAECSIDNLPDFEARLRARLPRTGLLRPGATRAPSPSPTCCRSSR